MGAHLVSRGVANLVQYSASSASVETHIESFQEPTLFYVQSPMSTVFILPTGLRHGNNWINVTPTPILGTWQSAYMSLDF